MKNKTIIYKSVTDEEISDAIAELSSAVVQSSIDNRTIVDAMLGITVAAWNISLFPPKNKNYENEIVAKLPKDINTMKSDLLKKFMLHVIKEKQEKYPDYRKGITSYDFKITNGKVELSVRSLPVKPLL